MALSFSFFVEKLRLYSQTRSKFIDQACIYLHFLENAATFHCLALFTTITCIVAIYAQIKRLTLFSLHPTCMIIGTFLFIAEGVVTYHNRTLVEALSPIMQHNKRQTKVRTLHQNIQTIGGSFLILGLLFIVAHKAEEKYIIVPHTFHSLLGTFVISLVIVQIISGSQKMSQMERSNTKIRRWHGDLGLFVWDLLCITVIAGFIEFFNITFTHILVEVVIAGLWLATHIQMKRKVMDRAGNIVPATTTDSEETSGLIESEDNNNVSTIPHASREQGTPRDGFEEDSRSV